MKQNIVRLRLESELMDLIDNAAKRTGFSRNEVVKQALRRGIPQIVQRSRQGARTSLVDALFQMKGLEINERRRAEKTRWSGEAFT
jgi:metal-responsive CopG/Arc/MetJ family transcriptional regulator